MTTKTALRATVLEYEHALEHAVEDHKDMAVCTDCQRLCQSALDGVNRKDFTEIARERRWWWTLYYSARWRFRR